MHPLCGILDWHWGSKRAQQGLPSQALKMLSIGGLWSALQLSQKKMCVCVGSWQNTNVCTVSATPPFSRPSVTLSEQSCILLSHC